MSEQRKNFELREKDFRLAIFRIEQGRSKTKTNRLSVAAVAREVGVTPALIHNHYPAIAETIRVKQGASSRQHRDATRAKLREEREKNSLLRQEFSEMKHNLARLASINEMLLMEIRLLKAAYKDKNVAIFGRAE